MNKTVAGRANKIPAKASCLLRVEMAPVLLFFCKDFDFTSFELLDELVIFRPGDKLEGTSSNEEAPSLCYLETDDKSRPADPEMRFANMVPMSCCPRM